LGVGHPTQNSFGRYPRVSTCVIKKYSRHIKKYSREKQKHSREKQKHSNGSPVQITKIYIFGENPPNTEKIFPDAGLKKTRD
jgi:hypothetical protein